MCVCLGQKNVCVCVGGGGVVWRVTKDATHEDAKVVSN
jgi:hypothetical protein